MSYRKNYHKSTELPHYRMNPKVSKVLKEEVVSSTEISEEMKSELVGEHKPLWQHNALLFMISKIQLIEFIRGDDVSSFGLSYFILVQLLSLIT